MRAGVRAEAVGRVLGGDAALERGAAQGDGLLGQPEVGERLAGGDAQLGLDEVDVGDLLGHRVLDLDARVHLDEDVVARRGRAGTRRCPRCGSRSRGRTARRRRRSGRAAPGSRFGAGASSITFWWRRCTEQSRSKRWMTLPCPSARICTSMWRGSTTAFSRKTVGSPNADAASRDAASMDSRSCGGVLDAPHAASAAAGDGLDEHAGSRCPRRRGPVRPRRWRAPRSRAPARRPRGRRPPRAPCCPVSSRISRAGADERDARLLACPGQVGVLGQEPVARVDRVGARPAGRADDLLHGEIGPHGVSRLADLVGLVGLQPVQRVAVLVREDGDGPRAQLVAGAERADRDLTTVGDQHLAEHSGSLRPAGEEHHGLGNAAGVP